MTFEAMARVSMWRRGVHERLAAENYQLLVKGEA